MAQTTEPEILSSFEHKTEQKEEYLKEQFFLCLSRVNEKIYNEEGKVVTIRKYYNQAIAKMYLIPVTRPAIPFVIDVNDISTRVRDDFLYYCKETNEKSIRYFVKDVAMRFFENFDYEFCHTSVMRSLQVIMRR